MHKEFFGQHMGHLIVAADQIARRHGGRHVNIVDAGSRRGWFEVPSTGGLIDSRRMEAIVRDVKARGGIKALMYKCDQAVA